MIVIAIEMDYTEHFTSIILYFFKKKKKQSFDSAMVNLRRELRQRHPPVLPKTEANLRTCLVFLRHDSR